MSYYSASRQLTLEEAGVPRDDSWQGRLFLLLSSFSFVADHDGFSAGVKRTLQRTIE